MRSSINWTVGIVTSILPPVYGNCVIVVGVEKQGQSRCLNKREDSKVFSTSWKLVVEKEN